MTTVNDALFNVALPEHLCLPVKPEEATVVAIVRLAENGRSWFITAVCRTTEGIHVYGYEPGCSHADERWFDVSADFFDVAARANEDSLEIKVFPTPVPLATLEDVAL